MKINWFTVIAQVINFLILVWLLKRFLYKPILEAVREREDKIKAQLEDAKAKKEEGEKERRAFMNKKEEFESQQGEMMENAISEAEKMRQKLMDEARSEASDLRIKMEKAINETQENLEREIAEKTTKEVFEITGKVLADLASASLDEQMTAHFIKKLKGLEEEEKSKFLEAFKSSEGEIKVIGAFEFTEGQKTSIQNAVNEMLGGETQIEFLENPSQISGIELTAGGYKLAWSVSAYLKSLQQEIKAPEEKNEE